MRNMNLLTQMTKIYFSYVSDVCLCFLAHNSQKLWNYLSLKSIEEERDWKLTQSTEANDLAN